jgi:hypothetical protein
LNFRLGRFGHALGYLYFVGLAGFSAQRKGSKKAVLLGACKNAFQKGLQK